MGVVRGYNESDDTWEGSKRVPVDYENREKIKNNKKTFSQNQTKKKRRKKKGGKNIWA